MENSVVLDFDGTLIAENSTRVLERVIFSSYDGGRRGLIDWLYFGNGQRILNILLAILHRFTRRNIDWRFLLFFKSIGAKIPTSFDGVIAETASRLTLNKDLLVTLEGYQEIAILSCGMSLVIDEFCKGLDMNITLLAASNFSLEADGRNRINLLEPKDKISILLRHPSKLYITDDAVEAAIIATAFGRTEHRSFSISEDHHLFFVVNDQ